MIDVIAFVDEGLGNSSYLIDLGDGRGFVVDPSRDASAYLARAERLGLKIAWAVETHLHADFVSGSRELAARGASVLAPAAGSYGFDHVGMGDGDEIDLGGLTLRAIATPGHTPEHLSYVVLDGGQEIGVFTGGALLVGSVARTDLISNDQTVPLTRAAYRSARRVLRDLEADVAVYPTHGAGSFCSLPTSTDRTTTIGRERSSNQVCVARDEDAFVASLLDSLGSFPPYFLRLRTVNQSGPVVFGDDEPVLSRLSVSDAQKEIRDGAIVIDARPFKEFAAGHVPGSMSNELRPQFASWLGWLVPEDRRLVFVMSSGQDRLDLVRQCLKIGYERLAGELDGGMDAWRLAGADVAATGIVSAGDLRGTVVDVRQEPEVAEGRIAGALNIELGLLESAELPEGPVTLYCGHGQRGMTGASLLERVGRTDLHVLEGGPKDWSAATGQGLESPA